MEVPFLRAVRVSGDLVNLPKPSMIGKTTPGSVATFATSSMGRGTNADLVSTHQLSTGRTVFAARLDRATCITEVT